MSAMIDGTVFQVRYKICLSLSHSIEDKISAQLHGDRLALQLYGISNEPFMLYM